MQPPPEATLALAQDLIKLLSRTLIFTFLILRTSRICVVVVLSVAHLNEQEALLRRTKYFTWVPVAQKEHPFAPQWGASTQTHRST